MKVKSKPGNKYPTLEHLTVPLFDTFKSQRNAQEKAHFLAAAESSNSDCFFLHFCFASAIRSSQKPLCVVKNSQPSEKRLCIYYSDPIPRMHIFLTLHYDV